MSHLSGSIVLRDPIDASAVGRDAHVLNDVMPILQSRCRVAAPPRPGESGRCLFSRTRRRAPFAAAILETVRLKKMPPRGADLRMAGSPTIPP